MDNNGAEGQNRENDPGRMDNSENPHAGNTESENANNGSGHGINLKKADDSPGGESLTGFGPESAAAPDSGNPCDRELFFEKRISLFHLIIFSPLIVTGIYIVYTILVWIICLTGLGVNGQGFVAFMNVTFILVVMTVIHILIAWLIGRDVKRSGSPLKKSFYARPVFRYFFSLPLIWLLSWFYIMAYGISKIGRTGPQRFHRLTITKAIPVIITAVSYMLLFAVDVVEIPEGGRVTRGTKCHSAEECLRMANNATENLGNCSVSLHLYQQACNLYSSGKGCFDAGMCLMLDERDKNGAREYFKKACRQGISFSCE